MAGFSHSTIYRPERFGGWVFSCALSHSTQHTTERAALGDACLQPRRANQMQWTFSAQVIILQEIMRVKELVGYFLLI